MTMSASSLGLELIMRELAMGDIRGSGDTSARAHKALIIAVVTRGIYISASRMMPSLLMVEDTMASIKRTRLMMWLRR